MNGAVSGRTDGRGHDAQVHLLGGFRLRHAGTNVVLPHSAERLLAFLALRPAALPRSLVAGQLYGEADEDHARASLRSALWRLRQVCPGLVRCDSASIELQDVWLDVREVEHGVSALLADGTAIDTAVVHKLRCDLLPGWYDDWLLYERERLRQHCLFGLEAVAQQQAAAGAYAQAVDAALSALQLDPFRERGHHMLIEIHLAAGERLEAARALAAYEELLQAEFGLAPPADLTRRVSTATGVAAHSAASRRRA